MIEVFVLIGWIDGVRAGGVVNQEFFSLETCEAAKAIYVQMHEIPDVKDRRSTSSWVDCVKK